MNKDGSNVQSLTFAGRYNASPSWSPDGKLIAFAGYDKTHFDIFTVDVNTKQLTRITKATKANGKEADNEDPSFSPDGRHIMYVSNRTVNNQIYISNLDGLNERRITVDDDSYFKPKWSGYIE